jgi:putative tricarboxylic transport membrane protein
MFDRYASIIFIVLGIALFFYSQTLTTSIESHIGPKELPMFLSVALVFTGILNLIAALRAKAEKKKEGLEYRKFLIILGSLLLYVFLLEPVGYVISTFVFLLVAFQTMERGQIWKSAIIAAAFSGGIYYLYVEVALGSLPGLPFIE